MTFFAFVYPNRKTKPSLRERRESKCCVAAMEVKCTPFVGPFCRNEIGKVSIVEMIFGDRSIESCVE